MASKEAQEIIQAALVELATRSYRHFYPRVPSKTLQRAMSVEMGKDVPDLLPSQAALVIPHYWAVYLHDGRGPVWPDRARYIVFFRRIEDDPRVDGGKNYPVRASDIRKLSSSEYNYGLLRNRLAAQQGLPPYMYVLRNPDGSPRPAGKFTGNTSWFLEKTDVASQSTPAIYDLLDQYVMRNVINDTAIARAKIRVR